jgi:hypothetical protein
MSATISSRDGPTGTVSTGAGPTGAVSTGAAPLNLRFIEFMKVNNHPFGLFYGEGVFSPASILTAVLRLCANDMQRKSFTG